MPIDRRGRQFLKATETHPYPIHSAKTMTIAFA
ncbi:hypothetical protein BRAS3843_270031 [Bradyrhizobium sp. STM 3843]|nr:hypothetical protein BRAS3843_270031 [Bradyrhizobium sp. STM 3843]